MSGPLRRVAVETLGCRLNAYESDSLRAHFAQRGYRIVPFGEPADAVVVNTCTVTDQADRKSRQALYRAARSPGTDDERPLIVATGCMATGQAGAVASLPGVDYVVANDKKASVAALVDAHLSGEIATDVPAPGPFGFQYGEYSARARRSLKIQDGCDNHCSFCIIPLVRGSAVSRPLDQILEEARQIVDSGFTEIVITGVNIGRYRHGRADFPAVLEALLGLPGHFRVRLSSLEPEPLTDRFLDVFTDERLCPHLHLCLQSGSDRVLLAMRRLYDVESFERLLQRCRDRRPDLNATTDIIVGFPGEGDAEFQETCATVERCAFTHCHTFRFAPRAGTRSGRALDDVSTPQKKQRSRLVQALAERNRAAYLSRLAGHQQELLIESVRDGVASGYGECYVPIRLIDAGARAERELVDVRLTKPPLAAADPFLAVTMP